MRRVIEGLLLSWSLSTIVWSQEFPVEIQLVPPSGYVRTEPSHSFSRQPSWMAPPIVCSLCSELRGDGRCGCDRSLTQELADQLFDELRSVVEREFGERFALHRRVRVQVVDNASLRERGGPGGRLFGLYQDDVIYLDQDMRRRKAFAVLAHEYGHAWQYQENPGIEQIDELRFEGFAEWFAYRVVLEVGDLSRVTEIQRDTTVYGRGARWYLDLEGREGLEGVLRVARSRGPND